MNPGGWVKGSGAGLCWEANPPLARMSVAWNLGKLRSELTRVTPWRADHSSSSSTSAPSQSANFRGSFAALPSPANSRHEEDCGSWRNDPFNPAVVACSDDESIPAAAFVLRDLLPWYWRFNEYWSDLGPDEEDFLDLERGCDGWFK